MFTVLATSRYLIHSHSTTTANFVLHAVPLFILVGAKHLGWHTIRSVGITISSPP